MIIKEVKFSYIEPKYRMGPYIEFIIELDVPSLEYDDIVKAIEDSNPNYVDVRLMSFRKV